MNLPTFLVIGTAKAGTTALYHFLGQHPDVFMSPVKETNFFCFEGETPNYSGPGVTVNQSITTLEDYGDLFSGATDESALGEVSPMYMALPVAAERIRSRLPDVRLIVLLRHPVDRAYSSFLHLRRDGREPLADFEQALRAEPQRIADNWGFLWRYRQLSHYAHSLSAYFRLFPHDQIGVFLYDDFRDRPEEVMRAIFAHIGVDSSFQPRLSASFNISGEPRSQSLARALRRAGPFRKVLRKVLPLALRRRLGGSIRRANLVRPQLDPDLRDRMILEFEDDILDLGRLCGIDCSRWLEPRESP